MTRGGGELAIYERARRDEGVARCRRRPLHRPAPPAHRSGLFDRTGGPAAGRVRLREIPHADGGRSRLGRRGSVTWRTGPRSRVGHQPQGAWPIVDPPMAPALQAAGAPRGECGGATGSVVGSVPRPPTRSAPRSSWPGGSALTFLSPFTSALHRPDRYSPPCRTSPPLLMGLAARCAVSRSFAVLVQTAAVRRSLKGWAESVPE